MRCNIDRRGRALRTTLGALHIVIGVILAGLLLTGTLISVWWWIAAAALLAAGGFMVFEGLNGWCAVRAMGFKTPI